MSDRVSDLHLVLWRQQETRWASVEEGTDPKKHTLKKMTHSLLIVFGQISLQLKVNGVLWAQFPPHYNQTPALHVYTRTNHDSILQIFLVTTLYCNYVSLSLSSNALPSMIFVWTLKRICLKMVCLSHIELCWHYFVTSIPLWHQWTWCYK